MFQLNIETSFTRSLIPIRKKFIKMTNLIFAHVSTTILKYYLFEKVRYQYCIGKHHKYHYHTCKTRFQVPLPQRER